MCENNNTARFLKRKGLYIDAPITETMSILRIVLEKAGFREGVDMLKINNQYNDQYTTVRITKRFRIVIWKQENKLVKK